MILAGWAGVFACKILSGWASFGNGNDLDFWRQISNFHFWFLSIAPASNLGGFEWTDFFNEKITILSKYFDVASLNNLIAQNNIDVNDTWNLCNALQ